MFSQPCQIAALLEDLAPPWAFCGGWAIDLFLGRATRGHKDVDVAVYRRDQLAIRAHLSGRGWRFEKAHDGKLGPWAEGEFIDLPIHTVWCRNAGYRPDFLELLFNESDGGQFLFRRDRSITCDQRLAIVRAHGGLPVLAPEIVLLYKAKDADSAASDADFRSALPALDGGKRLWLKAALGKVDPGHAWLAML